LVRKELKEREAKAEYRARELPSANFTYP